jgi:addiction module RelB/DinJ family antitoxin
LDRGETMLERLGLTATAAITLFYRQIVRQRGLPFDLRMPNATTVRRARSAR